MYLAAGKLTQVLSAPDVHKHVVLPNPVEVVLVDHKKAASNHGSLDRPRWISLSLCLFPENTITGIS